VLTLLKFFPCLQLFVRDASFNKLINFPLFIRSFFFFDFFFFFFCSLFTSSPDQIPTFIFVFLLLLFLPQKKNICDLAIIQKNRKNNKFDGITPRSEGLKGPAPRPVANA
jgi:hypothetical protein